MFKGFKVSCLWRPKRSVYFLSPLRLKLFLWSVTSLVFTYETRWFFIGSDCIWTSWSWHLIITMQLSPVSWMSCHLLINKVNRFFNSHNPPWKDSVPICVTKVSVLRGEDGDRFQSQTWLRNHCPPEYSHSGLMPSLTACRCRLHVGVKKCENPDVPRGVGCFGRPRPKSSR